MARNRNRPSFVGQRALMRRCEAWNAANPVGSTVRYWTGLRGDGPGKLGQVLEPGAYVLSGHTPIVFIAGASGCIALTHVEREVA